MIQIILAFLGLVLFNSLIYALGAAQIVSRFLF